MVTVLILGGLGLDPTRHLISHLLSLPSTSPHRPTFVRIVDKALAIPQADAYTTYVDTDCRHHLRTAVDTGTAELVQGNLLTQATRDKAFALPDKLANHAGSDSATTTTKGFDWVFDFSGETDFAAPDVVHIERTLRLALLLGQSAVAHHAGVYIRTLTPFYRVEGDDKKGRVGGAGASEVGAAPWGTMASWHHEAARGLASIDGLNLVLMRPALLYGPHTVTGITPRCLIAEVYKFEGEKLDFLWSEHLAQHTVHARDFAAALAHAAAWAHGLGRARALEAHSEPLPTTLSSDAQLSALASFSPAPALKDSKVRAVVFSACDDGETTQRDIAAVIEKGVGGVKSGFHGSIISTFAKMNMQEVAEDVNDKHLESWSALLQASNPPLSSTVPVSPSVPVDLLGPNPIAFDNSALKRLTGWKPEKKLTAEGVRETVEGFKKEGHWPNAKPRGKKK
ncbi:hypothetical protein JCM9279_007081 [Rhodotorula babjevae]